MLICQGCPLSSKPGMSVKPKIAIAKLTIITIKGRRKRRKIRNKMLFMLRNRPIWQNIGEARLAALADGF